MADSEVATALIEVRLVGHSGLDLLTLSFSHFDPERTLVFSFRSRAPTFLIAQP